MPNTTLNERWADFIRTEYPDLPEITWVEDRVVSAFKIPFALRDGGKLLHAPSRPAITSSLPITTGPSAIPWTA